MLITAGVDGCNILQLSIKCKYNPLLALQLDPAGHATEIKVINNFKVERLQKDNKQIWIRGIYMDIKS